MRVKFLISVLEVGAISGMTSLFPNSSEFQLIRFPRFFIRKELKTFLSKNPGEYPGSM